MADESDFEGRLEIIISPKEGGIKLAASLVDWFDEDECHSLVSGTPSV